MPHGAGIQTILCAARPALTSVSPDHVVMRTRQQRQHHWSATFEGNSWCSACRTQVASTMTKKSRRGLHPS